MFDLFRSQAKATRYLLITLLSLVALSMVITLIPGFGSPSMGANAQVIAEVGGEPVTSRMVAEIIAAQMRSQNLAPSVVEIMLPQIVDRVVGEMATSYQARQLGFTVSDQETIDSIKTMMPQLFPNGEFAGKEAYQAVLAQANSSIADFERKVRQNLLLEKLQRVAFDGIVVPPSEVETEYRRKQEKVRLSVVKFDPTEIKKTLKVTKEEMQEFVKQNQAAFTLPPQRSASILIADVDKLGANLTMTDADLQRDYDAQRDRYKIEERVHARHILVKADSAALAADKQKAKAKAEDLLKQIKGGADFAKIAEKNSDDTSNASKGGDLDWFERNRMVKPFEDAAFSLKPKELSGVVETIFGYHIIQVLDRQSARVKPFAEVKAELATEYRKRTLFEKMPALADQARVELEKSPDKAAEIAQRLNLTVATVEKAIAGQEYPVLGRSPELDRNLAALDKGAVTPVMQAGDKLFLAVVTAITPSRPAELADVEERVREMMLTRKANETAEKQAAEFEARLKANGQDFPKTAKELNHKVYDTGEFDRAGHMKDIGPSGYFGEQPFLTKVGQSVGIYRVGSTPYYFKIEAHVQGDMSGLESQRATLLAVLKERKLRERRELFEEGLISSLKAKGVIKVYDDAVKRLAATYRQGA